MRSRLLAVAMLSLASAAACSVTQATGPDAPEETTPGSETGAQEGGPDTPPTPPPAPPGGGPTTDGGPATDGAVPSIYASDPLNCGALGHSCLGATCSTGVCKPEAVATAGYGVLDFTFDDDGALITVTDVKKGASYVHEIRRVSADGANAPLVFTRDYASLSTIIFTQGALFGEGSGITRYDGSGGGDAIKTILAPTGKNLVLSGADLWFEKNGELVRLNPTTNAMTTLPYIPNSGSKLAVYADAQNLYTVNTTNKILRIPKDGVSPHATITITGIPDNYVFDLFGTATTLGGVARKLGVDCATTTYTLWSAPIGGGAAKLLTTVTGLMYDPAVSGEYVYWTEGGCNSSAVPTRLMRRRADGSDAPLQLYTGPAVAHAKVKGDYVYWVDGKLQRVAK